ncbi:MAG: 50S ribosomal protein L9, partial [Fimbriimonadales bacterium]
LAERTAGQKAAAETLRGTIHGQTVRIEGKVGRDSTRLFGAVTSQDVVDAIKSQLKIDIDRRQVALIEPIKRLGMHEVELDLHREVDARVNVEVFDPNAVVEAPKTPEAPAPEDEREPVEA